VGGSDAVLDLERRGWTALATPGAAVDFFVDVLDEDVAMLFPGGMTVEGRDAVLRSMSGPPWSWFRLDDERVRSLADDVAVVTYRAEAQRPDAPTYAALCSSTYRRSRDGRWLLALHQQTPISTAQ